MRRKISMIVINTGKVLSLVIPVFAIGSVGAVLGAAILAILADIAGFTMLTAVKIGSLIGAISACAMVINHCLRCRHCSDNCRVAA